MKCPKCNSYVRNKPYIDSAFDDEGKQIFSCRECNHVFNFSERKIEPSEDDRRTKIMRDLFKLSEATNHLKSPIPLNQCSYLGGRIERYKDNHEHAMITLEDIEDIPKKSYYEKYKNFWENLGVGITMVIVFGLIIALFGWALFSFIRFDIQFYKNVGFSLSCLISCLLFCGFVVWYIIYYFGSLVPKWLKNLDEERGIKFNGK